MKCFDFSDPYLKIPSNYTLIRVSGISVSTEISKYHIFNSNKINNSKVIKTLQHLSPISFSSFEGLITRNKK